MRLIQPVKPSTSRAAYPHLTLAGTPEPDRYRTNDAGRALLSGLALGWPDLRLVLMGWSDDRDGAAAELAFVSKTAPPEEFVAAAMAACDC